MPVDYSLQYLTIESLADGNTVSIRNKACNIKPTFYYSTDGGTTWSSITAVQGSTLSVATIDTGEKILFKCTQNALASDWDKYNGFSVSKNYKVYGNVMSLIYGDSFIGNDEFANGTVANLAALFRENTTLIDASNLVLPSKTTLKDSYNGMFRDCSNLEYGPKQLPALSVGDSAYSSMFEACVNLLGVPEMLVTTFTGNTCCQRMFCMNRNSKVSARMTKSPLLKPATITSNCYKEMFKGNGSLVEVTCLATNISATDAVKDWMLNTSSTGTFIKASSMSSWPRTTSGIPSGWTVQDMIVQTIPWESGTGNIRIYYVGIKNGTILVESDGNNLYEDRELSLTVTTEDESVSRSVTVVQEAKAKTDLSTAVVTAPAQTYSGSALTPTPTVTLNGNTVPSTEYDVSYSDNINAGTGTITITGKNTYTGEATGTFTINKAAPTYTAPVANTLTYNGGLQYLITTGSTSHGTFQYSTNGTSWSSTRPTETEAGSYTAYWKLIGDSNHTDISSTQVSNVGIAQKALTITAKAQTINYGSSIATGTGQATTSGLVTGDSLTSITLIASTSSVPGGTITPSNAATTNGIANYSVTYATGTLTINKVAPTYSAPTAKSLTYNTGAQALVNAGSATGGTMYYQMTTVNTKPSSTSGFSTSIPTGTNAGTYYVWYYVKGDSNHNDTAISSSAVTVGISKASISPTVSMNGWTYGGTATNPSVSGNTGSGSVTYTYKKTADPDTSYSSTKPSNAGSYTVRAVIAETSNYLGATCTNTFTIAKANPTYTAPTARTGLTYSGSSQYLVTAGSTSHGTIQYSSNGTTWSTTRPSSTNAGSYTTYWRLVGDSNHNDVASTSLSTTIAKASRTLSFADAYVVLAPSGNITKTATPSAGSGDGAITYSISSTTYATINSSSGKVTAKTSDGSAVVTATIAEGTNYLGATASYNLYVFATTHNFAYTGSVQNITLPPGSYKLQCWGAQGGNVSGSYTASGSKGGYSEGVLTINQEKTAYIFVGGKGTDVSTSTTTSGVVNGGWNGGGGSTRISQYTTPSAEYTFGKSYPRGGGGGTDIALVTSSMSYSGGVTNRSSDSLLSRMIVAGGGGGASANYYEYLEEETQITETITTFTAGSYSIDYNPKIWRTNANYLGMLIDVTSHRGETCEFTAGSYGYTVYTFAKSAPVSGSAVDYATGYGTTGYNNMRATGSVTVPSDAIYLWININGGDTTGSRKPNKVEFSKVVTVTSSGSNVSSGKAYGGGTSGGGFCGGKQDDSGLGEGTFGKGATQTVTSTKFVTGGGGGGWYGGGRNTSGTSPSNYVDNGGGGSGFVNTAENAQYRPTGYTGLQLDSGNTYAGNTSFPSTNGGTETGHSGNGYAKITRL